MRFPSFFCLFYSVPDGKIYTFLEAIFCRVRGKKLLLKKGSKTKNGADSIKPYDEMHYSEKGAAV